MWNKQQWVTLYISYILILYTRAVKWASWKKSLLLVFCYRYRKSLDIFLGQDILFFCLDLQTLCVCLDSQLGEAMRCDPHNPSTPAQALYSSPKKYARLLSGANGMPCASTSKFSCRWGIKMEIGELKF